MEMLLTSGTIHLHIKMPDNRTICMYVFDLLGLAGSIETLLCIHTHYVLDADCYGGAAEAT
jgi:hypothetical protein